MKQAKLIALAMLMVPMLAFSHDDDIHQPPVPTAPAKSIAMSAGEIKKINKETGKVTIKHGPLENLSMPGMTMLFRTQDPAMLEQIKEGDEIRFVAEQINGTLVVKLLQVVK